MTGAYTSQGTKYGITSIDATIPTGSNLVLSVLDGVSNTPIPGYTNLDPTWIDLGGLMLKAPESSPQIVFRCPRWRKYTDRPPDSHESSIWYIFLLQSHRCRLVGEWHELEQWANQRFKWRGHNLSCVYLSSPTYPDAIHFNFYRPIYRRGLSRW